MKKIYIILLAAITLTSCGDDFLDKEPKNTVDPATSVTDDVAVAMANACYRTLQSSNMYNQRIWTLDIVAGNSEVGAGGGTDGLETIQAANFITQSDNGMALYMWRSPWVGIGQCNILIQALEGQTLEPGSAASARPTSSAPTTTSCWHASMAGCPCACNRTTRASRPTSHAIRSTRCTRRSWPIARRLSTSCRPR